MKYHWINAFSCCSLNESSRCRAVLRFISVVFVLNSTQSSLFITVDNQAFSFSFIGVHEIIGSMAERATLVFWVLVGIHYFTPRQVHGVQSNLMITRHDFPSDFIFGAGTSSYQVPQSLLYLPLLVLCFCIKYWSSLKHWPFVSGVCFWLKYGYFNIWKFNFFNVLFEFLIKEINSSSSKIYKTHKIIRFDNYILDFKFFFSNSVKMMRENSNFFKPNRPYFKLLIKYYINNMYICIYSTKLYYINNVYIYIYIYSTKLFRISQLPTGWRSCSNGWPKTQHLGHFHPRRSPLIPPAQNALSTIQNFNINNKCRLIYRKNAWWKHRRCCSGWISPLQSNFYYCCLWQ